MNRLVLGNQLSIRHAAATLGLSTTTGWRRLRWFDDVFGLPAHYGRPASPLTTPQRGTAACPNGRPRIPAIDEYRPPKFDTVLIKATGAEIPVCDCGALLVSTGGLANRWGISPERARQISHRADFPDVEAVDGMRRLFCASDVARWEHRRRPRDDRGRFRSRAARSEAR